MLYNILFVFSCRCLSAVCGIPLSLSLSLFSDSELCLSSISSRHLLFRTARLSYKTTARTRTAGGLYLFSYSALYNAMDIHKNVCWLSCRLTPSHSHIYIYIYNISHSSPKKKPTGFLFQLFFFFFFLFLFFLFLFFFAVFLSVYTFLALLHSIIAWCSCCYFYSSRWCCCCCGRHSSISNAVCEYAFMDFCFYLYAVYTNQFQLGLYTL